MAGQISIGSSRHVEEIRGKLDAEFRLFKAEGFELTLNENQIGDLTFLHCNLNHPGGKSRYTPDEVTLLFRYYIANVLSDVIIVGWERHLLAGLVKQRYNHFNERERCQIINLAFMNLDGGENKDASVPGLRKTRILQKIIEYLDKNGEMVIDGFVRFRLQEYMLELGEAVDTAVSEFLMEKEYNDFIRLLRYFVDIQEPRIALVHVVVKTNGCFQLFDAESNPLNSDYLDGFSLDGNEAEINYEDLLISALISLAPKMIVLHLPGGLGFTEAINTIKKVFNTRATVCPGCSKCPNSKQQQDR